jgi:hypothetical protein
VSGSTTTITTASFTAPANALLVAFNTGDSPAATSNSVTVSDSLGLTWTRAVKRNFADGKESFADIWTATTTSSAARTVSAAEAVASTPHALVVKVFTDTGTPTVGAVNGAVPGGNLPTCNLTTTANDSWVWACSGDWNAGVIGTAGTSQTLTTSDSVQTANFTGNLWRRTATTATPTAVTLNLTAPIGSAWTEAVIEIKANTAATAYPFELLTPTPRYYRR